MKALGLKVLISLVTFVTMLGLAEVAFWIVGWPGDLVDVTFPALTTAHLETTEFQVEIRTNRFGLRDREYELKKDPDTFRTLVIGDSFTMGHGVNAEQTYPKLLEVSLNEGTASSVKYEVINAGLSTYGPNQYLRVLRALGPIFKPDLVVVCFFTGNDVSSMAGPRTAGAAAGPLRSVLPRTFYLFRRAWSELSSAARAAALKATGLDSGSLFALQRAIWRATGAADMDVAEQVAQQTDADAEQLNDWRHNRADRGRGRPSTFFYDTVFLASDEMRDLEQKAEGRLAQIHEEATRLGAATALVIAPPSFQVDRSQWPLYVAEGMYLDDRFLYEQPLNDRLSAFAHERQLPFLDLLPAFRARVRAGQRLYFPLDGHWNPAAHELVADALHELLKAEGLVPSTSTRGSASALL